MSQKTFERALIVGAGPIGLACALSAKRHGIDPLVIDAGAITNSILRYPIGMTFFTTPERLEIGDHPLVCAGQKPTREEVLKYYRGVVRTEALRVRTYTRLLAAERRGGGSGGGGGPIGCRLRTRLGEEEDRVRTRGFGDRLFRSSQSARRRGRDPAAREPLLR